MRASLEIRRRSARVHVLADDETLAWIRLRGAAFFELRPPSDPDCWLVVAGRENAPDAPDYRLHEVEYLSGERCRTLVSRNARAVVVDLPPGSWRQLYVLRLVRDVLRWELQASRPLYLHGASMAQAGDRGAICVIGPSGSGKSTLSYMMAANGWDWISQDDLCLVEERRGEWSVLGWPGSLRLRRTALPLFPDLAASLAELGHPANALERRLPPEQGFVRVFPEELAQRLGGGIRGEAPVKAFLVLDPLEDGKDCKRMPTDEFVGCLRRAWDVIPERRPGRRVEDVLAGRIGWSELVFNPLLLEHFGPPDLDGLAASLERLAIYAPVWRVGRSFWPAVLGGATTLPWAAGQVAADRAAGAVT